MIQKRLFACAAILTLSPILAAGFGMSVPAAIVFVLVLLLLRWAIVLSGFVLPKKTPKLALATMSASHFVEKVRWSMDRLGVDDTEQPAGRARGVFFLGRTVPQLRVRTGSVQSNIANSAKILRCLSGRYAVDDPVAAEFLKPRSRPRLCAVRPNHGEPVTRAPWVSSNACTPKNGVKGWPSTNGKLSPG